MWIVNLAVVAFTLALFLAGFDVRWAENLIGALLQNNYMQIGVSVVLGIFSWNLAALFAKSTELEQRVSELVAGNSPRVSLTEDDKTRISDAVAKIDGNQRNETPLGHVIGLAEVKKEIEQLSHFIASQKKRELAGLPRQKISLHVVFTGNPGTGKTLVAREIAKIYRSYGILEKGHLVETDRAGLVAEYVGQTAVKTKEKVAEAIGGVLFIDEAYSLVDGDSSGGFGKEAIDTLLKEMEDKRDSLVVIVAGYGREMESFISSNPGLKSRFSRTITFSDYSIEELMQIFELLAKTDGYVIESGAREWLAQWISKEAPIGKKGFGNGRFMRNLFEKTIVAQAHRLETSNANSKEALQLILRGDIESGATRLAAATA